MTCQRSGRCFWRGERCDPDTLHWAEEKLGVPVIDHWWQTESGWPMVTNPIGIEILEIKPGSPTVPVPGYDIRVLDDDDQECDANQIGAIVAKLPLPPGALPTLWNADEHFVDAYLRRFPGYYLTSDAGFRDDDGYVYIMSRIDDIINVAGHRLSTGAMEEVLADHPEVAECAVIGVRDELKGQSPVDLWCFRPASIATLQMLKPNWSPWSGIESVRWLPSSGRSWSNVCPRQDQERSYVPR